MSNVNDWKFANMLETLNAKVIEPQRKRTDEAQAIMDNKDYAWKDDDQKILAGKKLESYKQWLQYYLEFYRQGLILVKQHETLVNKMAKWYQVWYDNVSNEGVQETEIMPSQADLLGEIFADIYKELQPLKLEIKPPLALNMK